MYLDEGVWWHSKRCLESVCDEGEREGFAMATSDAQGIGCIIYNSARIDNAADVKKACRRIHPLSLVQAHTQHPRQLLVSLPKLSH